jgi:hypothetical protein
MTGAAARRLIAGVLGLAPLCGPQPALAQASPTEAAATGIGPALVETMLAGPAPAATGPIVSQPKLFTDDDLLLFAVTSGDLQLSDGFEAYSSRAGVFLPIGALARMLDLDISVDPQRQRAQGWVISPQRTVLVDYPARTVALAGVETHLSDADIAFKDGEIYLRVGVLEKILPLRITADIAGLNLAIVPTEPLPFQERLQRDLRRSQIGAGSQENIPLIPTPYRLLSAPSVDVNLTAGAGNHDPRQSGSYDFRAAGDVAGAGFQLFAGSDANFRLDSVRILLSRKDPEGKAAGLFGATRATLGDTFTPTMTLGARSNAGRGFTMTSEPLERASVFDKIDLRGELPLGYQVELYVNEVLLGSQAQPVQGRYDFQAVSLAYGLNVIRLVFYGSHGERREEVQRINVGGGQLAKGQTTYSFGAVQEGLSVLDVRKDAAAGGVPGQGAWDITASIAHGLTKETTVTAAFAQYTPRVNDTRQMADVGLVTSLWGSALQLDAAGDDKGGVALAAGFAGRYGATSVVARHSEYAGGFADEVQSAGVGAVDLRRNTTVTIDTILDLLRSEVPASFRLTRDQFADGGQDLRATARLSKAIGRYLISNALEIDRQSGGATSNLNTFNGALDVSALVAGNWQFRASTAYTIAPDFKVQSAGFTVDRNVGIRSALHFGVNHTFEGNQTTFEVGQTWRLRPADISIVGSYATKTNDLRIGVQLSLGFGYNPWRGRYGVLGPGIASGGAMAVDAFLDDNGNGRRDPGEKPLPGLLVQGGRQPAKTDADGHAIITGLGDSAYATAQVDVSSLDDPYLTPGAAGLKIVPRPGRIAVAEYPVTTTGELELHAEFQRPGEAARAISALHVELVDAAGRVVAAASSEFDGAIVVEGLRPGAYAIRLEASQAERLKIELTAPVTVKIAPGGGFAGRTTVAVRPRAAVAPQPEGGS